MNEHEQPEAPEIIGQGQPPIRNQKAPETNNQKQSSKNKAELFDINELEHKLMIGMTDEQTVLQMLKDRFPDIEDMKITLPRRIEFKVSAEKLIETCNILKNEMDYKGVSFISGVDRRTGFDVTYMLFSLSHAPVLVFTVSLPKNDPSVHTVCGVWRAANWYEREIYDMFGINFENHPDLRRIMLRDDADFFPLRKNYKLNDKPEKWQAECRRSE